MLIIPDAPAQTNSPPAQPKQSVYVAGFVLFCVVIGVWLLFKVKGTLPDQNSEVTLVLDKSVDGRATWTPVFTNTVILHGTNPVDFFRDKMDDDSAFYRVRVQK